MQEDTFIFKDYAWDNTNRQARFSYELRYGDEEFSFIEILSFPKNVISEVSESILTSILQSLHLALGISYFKLFCPKEIKIQNFCLSRDQAQFWNTLYTNGLGEFFYKNKIDFRGLISFPYLAEKDVVDIPAFPRQDRSLVGIGGGKDSIVAAELLKKYNKLFSAFVVNSQPLIEETINILGVDKVEVKRELDPQLFVLNKRSDTYNGHVPISAQIAFIGIFTALLYDYKYVVVSNEHSANYGNTKYLGEEINHQWSKTLEFEKLFQNYVKSFITADVLYFSILRPYSEFKIAESFTKYPQYFPVFSSCNRNFKLQNPSHSLWCGECPKCAFVFVMLAAFLAKEEVIKIFGQDLLAKESLVLIYRELLGIDSIKPFECVGTPDEVKLAFYLAKKQGGYDQDIAMQLFEKEIKPQQIDFESLKKSLESSFTSSIPEEFKEIIL